MQTLVAASAYLGFAIFITWPLAIHPRSTIFGFVPSDLSANIARFHELAVARQPPFLPGHIDAVNVPDGLPSAWALDLASFPSSCILWALSMLLGAIAANGVFALASFAFSAISMFLLARWITGHAGASFIAGLAYGFWPWVFSTATQPFGHGWVFVVVVWRALVMLESPTVRSGLIFGLAAALSMTWLQYWILIGGVLYATLAAVTLLVARLHGQMRRQLPAQFAALCVVLLLLAGFGILAKVAPPSQIPTRSSSEMYVYAARPLMYVTPHPSNAIVGEWTRPFLLGRFDGTSPERPAYANIYLGLSTLALAALGLSWVGRRLRQEHLTSLRETPVVAGVAAAFAALVALLFSAPPRVTVLGLQIPMPAEVVGHFTTVFRTTHRFGLVVMLGACILAACGLRAALARYSSRTQAIVLGVLAVVVPLDLWAREYGSSRVNPPPMFAALKNEPPGVVAAFPLTYPNDLSAVFYRPAHGKPIFNGYWSGRGSPPASPKEDFQELGNTVTVERLATLGVRYVVVVKGGTEPWQPRPDERFDGLRVLRRTREGTAFRVIAKPAAAVVLPREGFGAPERFPPVFMRWITHNKARIELRGDCAPCVGRVRFRASSFAQPRLLIVRDKNGQIVRMESISIEPSDVSFPVRFDRETEFVMTTTPGPEAIERATGVPDPRSVSIQVVVPMIFTSE
jgi:hypothetical protein